MTGIFWPIWWVGEAVVWAGLALIWAVPARQARRCSHNARKLHELGVVAAAGGQPYEEIDALFVTAHLEWEECFAWHAARRRIHKVTLPLAVALLALTILHSIWWS